MPARARIFETLGIDYCCGGKKSLAEACRAKGLDPVTAVALLAAIDDTPETSSVSPDAMGLAELCDHIEHVHHKYLRDELPRLDFMTRKVAAVHGDHEPRLHELRHVFELFNAEMIAHTKEEESVVFPKIRELAKTGRDAARFDSDLNGVFTKLGAEHDSAGAALSRFRDLTDGYTPPAWACNTFRALYDGLQGL